MSVLTLLLKMRVSIEQPGRRSSDLRADGLREWRPKHLVVPSWACNAWDAVTRRVEGGGRRGSSAADQQGDSTNHSSTDSP